MRKWQRPRTSSTSGTSESDRSRRGTPTEQRVVVPPEIPHDARNCIEDLDFEESDSDESREEREMQDECRRWNAQTETTWVKEASKLMQRDFQGLRMELEEDPDGEVLTMDEWKQLCVEIDAASERTHKTARLKKLRRRKNATD